MHHNKLKPQGIALLIQVGVPALGSFGIQINI